MDSFKFVMARNTHNLRLVQRLHFGVCGGNFNLGDRLRCKFNTFESVVHLWYIEHLHGLDSVEESVNFSASSKLNDLPTSRVNAQNWADAVDIVGKNEITIGVEDEIFTRFDLSQLLLDLEGR